MIFKVASENLIRKPYLNWAVKRVARSLQVLWPRSRTNIFGSNATGLSLPSSDVDLVVCLPPVRNLVSMSRIICTYVISFRYGEKELWRKEITLYSFLFFLHRNQLKKLGS